jgi:hypothetical protein
MGLPYKEPIEVVQYKCQYCGCRFESKKEHDNHHKEQHGKHGLPFHIAMELPPLEEEE